MNQPKNYLDSPLAVVLLSLSLMMVYLTANAPTSLYPIWQKHIGYSDTGIGMIFVVYHLGIALSLFLLQRPQRRQTTLYLLIGALVGSLLSAGLFATAQYFWQLVAARFIIGLCCGVFVSSGISLIIKIGLQQQIRNIPLIVTLSCVFGFGIGPFYGGVLADLIHHPFAAIFFPLMFVLGICTLLLIRFNIPTDNDEVSTQTISQQPIKRNIPLMVGITGIFASPFALAGLFISLGPSMIADLMHTQSHTIVGAIALLLFGSGFISQLALHKLSVNWQILVGTLTAFIGGVTILTAEVTSWVWMMALAAIFIGVAQSLTQLAGTRLIKQYNPMGSLQRSTSIFFLGGYLFAAATIFLLGWVATHLGLQTSTQLFLYICFMVLAASFGVYILTHPQSSHED